METINLLLALCRGVERLLIIGGGLACITLGYRLFLKAIVDAGELVAEGAGYKLQMQRIGPGVFFALFGAFVLSYSLARPLSFATAPTAPSTTYYGQDSQVRAGDAEQERYRRIRAITEMIHYAERRTFPDVADRAAEGLFQQQIADLRNLRRILLEQEFGAENVKQYMEAEAAAVSGTTGPVQSTPQQRAIKSLVE